MIGKLNVKKYQIGYSHYRFGILVF